jgi:hypothetical protein
MPTKKSTTRGKRTARPGSRRENTTAKATVRRGKKLPATGGKRAMGVTTTHRTAHARAAGQRKHNRSASK